jgi:hypothetical protein
MTTQEHPTTTLQVVLAWGFVGIPLTWGVLQTLVNAMKLFQESLSEKRKRRLLTEAALFILESTRQVRRPSRPYA